MSQAGADDGPATSWLRPGWQRTELGAVMTTRAGGGSGAPWTSLNLGDHVGDDRVHVVANRRRFEEAIGARPVYLRQVHGIRVARLDEADLTGPPIEADASVTDRPGIACTILVADCLPVLFAAPGRRGVGAAHAGWRGLAGGVLESTLAALCELARCAPGEVDAWVGVGIGPQRFEIGAEVVEALGGDPAGTQAPSAGFGRHAVTSAWCADLSRLAADRLRVAGLRSVERASGCTASEPSRFFSYRRDGVTGRMAAAVWIREHAR